MAQVKFRFAPARERSVESRQEAKELGETGEQMAARYLEKQGCVILERHYRKDHKEVDIIALDHGELAVIEVKTRTNEDLFAAEQAVDHRKRQNIIRVANNYMRRYHRTEPLRFDIIAIVGSGEDVNVVVVDTEVYSNTGGQSSKATRQVLSPSSPPLVRKLLVSDKMCTFAPSYLDVCDNRPITKKV